jgi:hypothetical protein
MSYDGLAMSKIITQLMAPHIPLQIPSISINRINQNVN